MNTKVCKKCGEERALEEFYRDSSKGDGRQSTCKACVKQYRQANRERIREYKRGYDNTNKHKQREYYKSNREYILRRQREYYQTERTRILKQQLKYYRANKEQRRGYENGRYISDPLYALSKRCRNRIRDVLRRKGFPKNSPTAEMLGCTWEELAAHLESQFTDDMSWDNLGDWHIDHIVPLASANTKEETVALNHYTNLQPLWAEDNLRKGATVPQDNNCTELLT